MDIQFAGLIAQGKVDALQIEHWHIQHQQSWGIFVTEGDSGSLIGDLLCGEIEYQQGSLLRTDGRIAQVSLEEQQRLLERELNNDDTDFLDRIDTGSRVEALIQEQSNDYQLTEKLLTELDLLHLRNSGFRVLSTGETRRVILARALASDPDFLVLDNPFTGLDTAHRQTLALYLHKLSQSLQMLVCFSREEDLPEWIEHIALFERGKLDSILDKRRWDSHPVIKQIKQQADQQSEEMLSLVRRHTYLSPFDDPLFSLTDGHVAYTDKTIFTAVDWEIKKGEHWQISGPNGCGKSTLLGLIFGDHPQCYSNNIQIFGRQRGSGETIWEIKKHIGMVSSALHLQYRVNCCALDVILSGFYDSIGIYQQPTKDEINIARDWLKILHMQDYAKTSFKQLEYGQQRLLLIARAIVKRPTLLILDEPYQGLDYLGRRLVKNALELIAREQLCQLLYVSHYHADKLDSIKNYLDFVPIHPSSSSSSEKSSHQQQSLCGYTVKITRQKIPFNQHKKCFEV
ncbi:molybdate ABC transporter ATP-binding protein ModF [Vibrio sinensis]|uniref:Molybdate ABC transporter ATP-binding protein ModF n=1 Tax=Vibrio sinensis TaxID=2302434 RepID=A0A3A6QC37_9VIBR|nr:molybdate ABC transporter ATP-binding protein ModF [Vibrio sinensis]RJX66193.1 molybdate ABC transporter ATP-binding protein ModF [Vibrio sinensis]